jgi:nucleotide-binding universal stress UspA family protein
MSPPAGDPPTTITSNTDQLFAQIVVGSDGTDEGQDAVALGAALASISGAGLLLVRVFPTPLFPTPGSTDRATLRERADEGLRRDRDLFAPQALIHAVADSSVPRALLHFAQRTHAGLIVIGSAPAPDEHASIGRRGRQLLHDMPFALALARRRLHEGAIELRRVGVGYDGGPESLAALGVAIALCRAAGATLVVRTVVENRLPAFSTGDWMDLRALEAGWGEQRQSAQAEAERAVSALKSPAEVIAVIGDPGLELRGLSGSVDLLVVGSRRWGPVARLVTGGVGETLVAQSSCSVLIVPRPATTEEDAVSAGATG